MELASFQFILLLAVTFLVFFSLPHRFRWLLLLAASAVFYLDKLPIGFALLLISIAINYFGGLVLQNKGIGKLVFWTLIFVNVGMLAAFKLLTGPIAGVQGYELLAGLGISFYTFTQLSYVIDVYKKKTEPETNIGMYALYASFFPKLLAGPIERSNLISQFRNKISFDEQRVTSGLKLILFGMFKKVVASELMARSVNNVFSAPEAYAGPDYLIAILIYAFQIYFDFSAYTDIAIGSARIFGYELTQNFKLPYFARSIPEFWRRWHISLSSWLKDYLYIPLGGGRGTKISKAFNLILVFVACGLWHGIGWTFIAWGALHGAFMAIYSLLEPITSRLSSIPPKIRAGFGTALTFLLVCTGWTFFRAENVEEALMMLKNIGTGWGSDFLVRLENHFGIIELVILLALTIAVEIAHYMREKEIRIKLPSIITWPIYLVLIWAILLFMVSGMFKTNFIYAGF